MLICICTNVVGMRCGNADFLMGTKRCIFLGQSRIMHLRGASYRNRACGTVGVHLRGGALQRCIGGRGRRAEHVHRGHHVASSTIVLPHVPRVRSLFSDLVPCCSGSLAPPSKFTSRTVSGTVTYLLVVSRGFCPALFSFLSA